MMRCVIKGLYRIIKIPDRMLMVYAIITTVYIFDIRFSKQFYTYHALTGINI